MVSFIHKNIKIINITLLLLWSIALISAILLFMYISDAYKIAVLTKDNTNILSAFFILLSACIASASVMKSIIENRELKKYEMARIEKSQILFMLNICEQLKERYKLLDKCNFISKTITANDFSRLENDVIDSKVLFNKLMVDKYFLHIGIENYSLFYDINSDIYKIELLLINAGTLTMGHRIVSNNELTNLLKKILSELEKLFDILDSLHYKDISL